MGTVMMKWGRTFPKLLAEVWKCTTAKLSLYIATLTVPFRGNNWSQYFGGVFTYFGHIVGYCGQFITNLWPYIFAKKNILKGLLILFEYYGFYTLLCFWFSRAQQCSVKPSMYFLVFLNIFHHQVSVYCRHHQLVAVQIIKRFHEVLLYIL